MQKFLLTLLLCCTLPFFGQIKNAELNSKVNKINLHVKFVDSIASYSDEEISEGVTTLSHGRVDGKEIRKLLNSISIIRHSNQIIRICYKQRHPDSDEELSLYFLDQKLVYAEQNRWKGRRNRFSTAKFYYEDESEIYATDSKNYPIEGVDILIQAKELVKQSTR